MFACVSKCVSICRAFQVHRMVLFVCVRLLIRLWVAQLAGEAWIGKAAHKKKNDWSPLSWLLCFSVPWCCTRCVPWACIGFNTWHSIFLQSTFKLMHLHMGSRFQSPSCPWGTILLANNIIGSWLRNMFAHFSCSASPQWGDSVRLTCFINTNIRYVLLTMSLLPAVMMYFTWQQQWNPLHPGDGTEGRKMEIHLLNTNPFSITTKTTCTWCVSLCVFVLLLRKGIALKYNTIFEEMGKSLLTSQVWKHIMLSAEQNLFSFTWHPDKTRYAICFHNTEKCFCLNVIWRFKWFHECNNRFHTGNPDMDLIEPVTDNKLWRTKSAKIQNV